MALDFQRAQALALVAEKVSASKANLLEACPAAAALDWVRSFNPWSGTGQAIHDYLELLQRARNGEVELRNEVGDVIPPEALHQLARAARRRMPQEHRLALEAVDLDRLPLNPGLYRVGEAFAYNWRDDTGRRLEKVATHRAYQGQYDATCEIPGTLDVRGDTGEGDPAGRAVIVVDYKLWARDSPPVGEDLQLLTYALGASRALGYERAIVVKIRVRDGHPTWEWAELDTYALDGAAERVRRLMERVLAVAPVVASSPESPEALGAFGIGRHCGQCPAAMKCPARMALVRELVAAASGQGSFLPPEIGPWNQDEAYRRLEAASGLLADLWQSFDDYARQAAEAGHPVKAGNGYVYAPARRRREGYDAFAAALLLAEAVDVPAARAAVKVERFVTAASLDEAVEQVLDRTKTEAALARKLLDLLEPGQKLGKATLRAALKRLLAERGGSYVTDTFPVTRHKPRDEDGPPDRRPLDDLAALASGAG